MIVARTVPDLRAFVEQTRAAGESIGFVPTMGALHDGHISLVRAARSTCDRLVASIFVNPLQFGPGDDFDTYPRTEEADLALFERERVDLCFVPSTEDMYPPGSTTTVNVGRLGKILEGAARPGHFEGVATVVARLFNLVQPSSAFFGQKDAQQLAVIERMVADLGYDISIVRGPTVRDDDSLALSSRNVRLAPEDRQRAATLYLSLLAGRSVLDEGGDAALAEKRMQELLAGAPGVEPDYARAVDPETFDETSPDGPVLLLVAARVGETRLIDNLLVIR